jgi:hypothetical protein
LRATAILELAPNGRARLIPIIIKIGDKFFDGGLYHADPSPMTLESGTVYEAERAGDPLGLFTITQSQEVSGVWIGLGKWRAKGAAAPETSPGTKTAQTASPDQGDERPILRRQKSTATLPSATPTPAPTPSPTPSPLPESKTAATATPLPSPQSSTKPTNSAEIEEADPARPILRRGKPTDDHQSADGLAPLIAEKPGASPSISGAATALALGTSSAGVEVLAAVSDAAGPDPQPYTMQLNPEEHARYEKAIRTMAYAAIAKYAATRAQHKPAAATEMSDSQLHVFDAHGNNEPDLVFSATLPEKLPAGASSQFHYAVTVVASVDIYGEMRQLFAQVTDSAHLDVYPRLELIDVVDAEGTGSGQLLFREVSDTGYDYVLYRVGADKLWPLFQGSGKNF